MSQRPDSTAQARPGLPDGARCAWFALVLCAALATPCVHAGRTDSDWMAPAQPELPMDAAGGPDEPGVGRTAHAAMVSEMRIATHEEARALLQGSVLPGDVGAGTATLSALLDRLSATMPSSAVLAPELHGVAGADLDCALFAEDVRVRRLLGAGYPHMPGEDVGPESAVALDIPIRCIAKVSRTPSPSPGRQSLQPASDQGTEDSGVRHWQTAWVRSEGVWWMAFAGSAVVLVGFGLVARVRARDELPDHR